MARPRAPIAAHSAVSRLLDAEACADVSRADSVTPVQTPRSTSRFRKRQVILDDSASKTLERLTDGLRRATHTRLTTSHAIRALLMLIDSAIEDIAHFDAPAEAMYLPNNAPRFDHERRRFEQLLAGMIRAAWSVRPS